MKKYIKKILVLLLVIFIGFVTGCKDDNSKYKVLTPEGIPLIAIGGVLEKYDVTTTAGPSLLQSELMKEDYDVIVAPLTLGKQLYEKGALKYKLAALITFNNMFIISRKEDKLDSINDLENQTIYTYGMNQPSDIALKYALKDIKCNFEYVDSVATVVSSYFVPKTAKYALVAEPYLSKIKNSMNIDINVIDVASLFEDDELAYIPQAAIYINASNSKGINDKILKDIKRSVKEAKDSTNKYVEELLKLDKDLYPLFDSLGKDILASVIADGGISYLEASKEKENIEAYFKLINKENNKTLGEDIYYK